MCFVFTILIGWISMNYINKNLPVSVMGEFESEVSFSVCEVDDSLSSLTFGESVNTLSYDSFLWYTSDKYPKIDLWDNVIADKKFFSIYNIIYYSSGILNSLHYGIPVRRYYFQLKSVVWFIKLLNITFRSRIFPYLKKKYWNY